MEEDGVWKTICGRRVFIKTGQSLTDAMKESGKFNKQKNLTASEIDDRNKDVEELKEKGNFKISNSIKEKLDNNITEYYEKFHSNDEDMKIKNVQIQDSVKEMEAVWANQQLQYLANLSDEYYSNIISVGYQKTSQKSLGGCASNNYDMSVLMFQNEILDKESYTKIYKNSSKKGFNAQVDSENIDKAVLYHEFAHSLTNSDNKFRKNIGKELERVYNEYKRDISLLEKDRDNALSKASITNKDEDWEKALSLQKKYDEIFVSKYANNNWEEFSSECFTNGKLSSKSSEYSKKVIEIIDKYYKRR